MINVFVAEPNQTLRAGIKSVLQNSGKCNVIGEASSRGELICDFRFSQVDVLLLEPKIGGATGESLIRQLKALAPSVVMLGFSDLDELKYGPRVLRAGLRGLVKKCCGKDELIEAIRHVSMGRAHISTALAEELALGLHVNEGELPHQRLSERELDVLCRLVNGERLAQIAEDLFLSPKTVSTYKQRILQKLGMSNMSELIQYAIAHGLLEPALMA